MSGTTPVTVWNLTDSGPGSQVDGITFISLEDSVGDTIFGRIGHRSINALFAGIVKIEWSFDLKYFCFCEARSGKTDS